MNSPAAAAHLSAIVVNSATNLWYVTRATGLVALVLLTISMVLGVLASVRYERAGLPRFVTSGLHRNTSLLALAFTGAHIVTTLADTYAPVRVQDVVVPFISAYRPFWLGLGAIAFDLMLAATITSLLRSRMSYRRWQAVHLTSYLCWPVAVLHGLGTGSDAPVRWVLLLTLVCVALVTAVAGWRLAYGWPSHRGLRVAGAVAVVAMLIAGGTWLVSGPLQPGWARRSGTPPSLLHGGAGPESVRLTLPPGGTASPPPPGAAGHPR
jgi:predicted ferric reductase